MRYYRRFDPTQRIMHFFVVVSFLGLAVTGLPLKYAGTPWASVMAKYLGGFEALAFFHRVCGVITLLYFAVHLVLTLLKTRGMSAGRMLRFLIGPDSMVPNLNDVKQMIGHLGWFLGLAERPKFDRWTYWEKFDYWAVWWGVLIIGSSGLVLWFPSWFAQFLPGWMFNVAMIIHSDEALLATGFIFTVHFFNGHLRPGKFPMDMAIFTGKVSEHELEEDHPAWYQRLQESGQLENLLKPAPSKDFLVVSGAFGCIAVVTGLVMAGLIAWGLLSH